MGVAAVGDITAQALPEIFEPFASDTHVTLALPGDADVAQVVTLAGGA